MVLGREASLRQSLSISQALVNRWRSKMEEFQTLIPKVWMTKTASPRGAELARAHKPMWAAQECCLLVERGLRGPSTPGRLCRSSCGHFLLCSKVCSRPFMLFWWVSKGEIGATTEKRIQRGSSISLYQRLKMKNRDG